MDIIPSAEIGALLPLIARANEAAKVLSQRQYDREEQWKAEIKITLKHGLTAAEKIASRLAEAEIKRERFTVDVRISAYLSGRYLTLEEAELIIRNLDPE